MKMRLTFLIIIVSLLLISFAWGGSMLWYHLTDRSLTSKEERATKPLHSLSAKEDVKDIIAIAKFHPISKIEPFTRENTQVLVKNDILSKEEAESLLELDKLLSFKREKK